MEQNIDPPPLLPLKICFFPTAPGFDADFIRLLLRYLDLDDVFALRASLKRWKLALDEATFYWKRVMYKLNPLCEPSISKVAFYSLQGMSNYHVRSIIRLFSSQLDGHRFLVRQIITRFLKISHLCNIVLHPACYSMHPAAQNDPFSFYLEINFPGRANGWYQFFCVEGQTILWRKEHTAWRTIKNTELTANYRDGIQHYGH